MNHEKLQGFLHSFSKGHGGSSTNHTHTKNMSKTHENLSSTLKHGSVEMVDLSRPSSSSNKRSGSSKIDRKLQSTISHQVGPFVSNIPPDMYSACTVDLPIDVIRDYSTALYKDNGTSKSYNVRQILSTFDSHKKALERLNKHVEGQKRQKKQLLYLFIWSIPDGKFDLHMLGR